MSIDTARRVLEAIKKFRAASDGDSGDEENDAANELADAADAHLVDESSRDIALAEIVDEYKLAGDNDSESPVIDAARTSDAAPSTSAIVLQHRVIATADAIAGLDEIFRDLQTRFHDQWNWMDAAFYVECLRCAIEDLTVRPSPQPH